MGAPGYKERLAQQSDILQYAYAIGSKIITRDNIFAHAQKLANVYAPTGTVPYTIAPEIEGMMMKVNGANRDSRKKLVVDTNFLETKNTAVMVNQEGLREGIAPHVVINHADEVSYYVSGVDGKKARLIPMCAHRQDPKELKKKEMRFPGRALRYRQTDNGDEFLIMVATGDVVTLEDGSITFECNDGKYSLYEGDRVVFDPKPRLKRTRDIVQGVLDNRGALAVGLLVAETLNQLVTLDSKMFCDVSTIILATDFEEGWPNFGQGAEKAAEKMKQDHRFDQTRFLINDGHDVKGEQSVVPEVALVSPIVSDGRGPIMSPDQRWRMEQLMGMFTKMGGFVFEDWRAGATISRSDDQGLIKAGISADRITVAGPGMKGSHHDYERATEQSLTGLMETGQFLLMLSIAASKGLL